MVKPIRCTVLLFLAMMLPLTVSAHPGRTDSAGGHTDRSTGEYHYHHGYSAHQHYDMDGDGIVDCPYDFKDKSDHNNSDTNRTEQKGSYTVIEEPNRNTESFFTDILPSGITAFSVLLLLLAPFISAFKKDDLAEKIGLTGIKGLLLLIPYWIIVGIISLFKK